MQNLARKTPYLLSISIVWFDTPIKALSSAISSIALACRSLLAPNGDARVLITIVDNSDECLLELNKLVPPQIIEVSNCHLDLIQGHGNIGYGMANNIAFFGCDSTYHLFMNPDVELDSDCLVEAIRYLQANSDVAMISPYATNPDGDRLFLCRSYPSPLDFLLRGFAPRSIKRLFASRLTRYEMRDLSVTDPVKGIPIISGCFMLCRRDTIGPLGAFDPSYFLYFEDYDLSIRVATVSRIAFVPQVKITHGGGNAASKGVLHLIYFTRSGFSFFSRHGWLGKSNQNVSS